MPRIKMIIEYDGSNYHGFQRQTNAHTIQAQVEQSINRLTGEKVTITCAGRTDAGVHALGQVIAFDTGSAIPPIRWKQALNSFLPPDIQINESCQVEPDFHPRYHALTKHYQYRLYQGLSGQAFYHRYAWCNQEKLKLEAMQSAAAFFIGRHDFKAFCASGSAVKTYERHITRCDLAVRDFWITLDIVANGFLYNMVRIILGTLVEVGQNKYLPETIPDILKSGERAQAGPTAPPQGLYLVKVNY